MGKNNESSSGPKNKQTHDKFQICHLCMKNTTESAECSIKRCKHSFCFQCIISNFNKDFKPSQYVKQCWICFSCGGSCKCLFCTGIDRNRKKRSTKFQNSQKSPDLQKVIEQKQQQKRTPKWIDENQSQEQDEPNQKHKRRYQRRRLPAKKKIVFKYKTKKRLRNKGSNEIKNLLNNIEDKDKVLKIKREQFHKQSSEQNSQSQISQQQQSSSLSNQESINQQKSMSSENLKTLSPKKKRIGSNLKEKKQDILNDEIQSQKKSKIQSEFSSSLDYLQDQVKSLSRKLRSASKPQSSKRKQKNQFQEKLPTIKSMPSQKQIQIPQNKISKRGRKRKQRIQEKSPIKENQLDQIRKGGTRRANKQLIQNQGQEKLLSQKNIQIVKRGRYTRRMKKIEQNRNKKSDKRSLKEMREQNQGQQKGLERPKRSTRRNYVELQQGIEQLGLGKKSQRRKQNEMSQQMVQNSEQNEQDQQNQASQDQEIQKASKEQRDNQESEQQIDSEQERKKIKNKQMKKHYQEELEKNIQFQVDDSESSAQNQNSPKQILNQQSNQQSQNIVIQKSQLTQLQNIQLTQKYTQNNLNQIHTQSFSKIQKITQKNIILSPAKNFQQTNKIYRKGPGKRNHPNTAINKLNSLSQNQIAKKWSSIPDHYLLDIKNIQRLGHQALFARQNLTKQFNQLLQRRNRILNQKSKNFIENQSKLQ